MCIRLYTIPQRVEQTDKTGGRTDKSISRYICCTRASARRKL